MAQKNTTEELDEFLLGLYEFLGGHLIERGLIEDVTDDDDDGDEDDDADDAAEDEDSDEGDSDDAADEDADEDEDEDEDEEVTARREELLGMTVPALKKAVKAAELDPADMKGWPLADIVEAILEVEFGDDDVDLDDLAEDEDEPEPEPEPVKPAKKAAAKKTAAPAKKTTTKGRLRATTK